MPHFLSPPTSHVAAPADSQAIPNYPSVPGEERRAARVETPRGVRAVRLTVWDGAGVIGGNKILLETGGRRLLLDFGTSFSAYGQYFEEFLKPRSRCGILDYLEMDLVPPLRGIYREDLLGDRPEIWARVERRKPVVAVDRLDAVLLSHAHLDHAGNLGLLRGDIPVATSTTSAVLLKVYQDVAGGSFEQELTYYKPRTVGADGVTAATRGSPACHRPYHLLAGAWTAEAEAFWSDHPGKTGELQSRQPETRLPDGCPPVRFYPVDHSVPGCGALAVGTEAGWVVYTGDLRVHGQGGDATRRFLEHAAGLQPLVVLTEGTRVDGQPAPTEAQVAERCHEAVRGARGRLVVADFGPRNVERLLAFRQIAADTERLLVVPPKDAYLLRALRSLEPGIPDLASDNILRVYAEPKIHAPGWEQRLLDDLRAAQVTAGEIRAAPERYILAFSFFDLTRLIDIDPPPGGVYIYSNSPLYDEEMEIDFERLTHWLERFGLRLLGDPRRDAGAEHAGFHASGHISGEELLPFLRDLAPRYLVPVHTVRPSWFAERLRGSGIEVLIPEAGKPMRFGAAGRVQGVA
jgi:ribonuclease J